MEKHRQHRNGQLSSNSNLGQFIAKLLTVLFVAIFLTATPISPASAYVSSVRYVSTTGSDTGACTSQASSCLTITYAITQADAGDHIYIAAGTYDENLTIYKEVMLIGAGMNLTIIDGDSMNSVIKAPTDNLTVTDLTIQHGSGSDGGGIYQGDPAHTLSLVRVKVSENVASSFGGGIYAAGFLEITESIVSGNSSSYYAGAVLNNGGSLSRVTISENLAVNNYGGLTISGGVANLTNVTITGNTAANHAGLINTGGANTTLLNCTIADNHLSVSGSTGGMVNWATIHIKNTIFAENDGSNCGNSGTFENLFNNLDSGNTCSFAGAGDLINTNPLLGTLADNGGPTPTMALLAGSPAINAGNSTGCPVADQRGVVRPQGSSCDIGAFESTLAFPAVPADVMATHGNYYDRVEITWSASSNATYYEVYRNSINSPNGASLLASPTALLFNDTSATAGVVYFYFVKGCNASACSVMSLSDAGFRDITTLPVPANLIASDGTYFDKVHVSWDASSGATYYEVYRSLSDSTLTAGLIASPASSPYDDTTADGGTIYWYFVKACNGMGCSDFSASDSGFDGISPVMDTTLTTSKVAFEWYDVPDATAYKIQLAKTNTFVTPVFTIKTSISYYEYLTTLNFSRDYYWRIAAKVGGVWGAWSQVYHFRSMDPLAKPTLVEPQIGDILTTHTIELTWEGVTNAAAYKVQVAKDPSFTNLVKNETVNVSPTTYNLANGKYYWRVKAVDASSGKGPWSEIWMFKVKVP